MRTDLTRLDDAAARRCGDALAHALDGAGTLEAAARALCGRLYDDVVRADGGRACVLVRCYATHPYGGLPPELQRFAKRALGRVAFTPPEPAMRCLVLLATTGDEPAWNDRRASRDHQAIPLPSPHVVERAPMIARLVRELGIELTQVVRPGRRPGPAAGAAPGLFHVPEAAGSPHIPAQAGFVDRHDLRSVLGFGGLLPTQELFATILFSRVPIDAETADRSQSIAAAVQARVAACATAVFGRAVGCRAGRG